jgi:hypothetical protein
MGSRHRRLSALGFPLRLTLPLNNQDGCCSSGERSAVRIRVAYPMSRGIVEGAGHWTSPYSRIDSLPRPPINSAIVMPSAKMAISLDLSVGRHRN